MEDVNSQKSERCYSKQFSVNLMTKKKKNSKIKENLRSTIHRFYFDLITGTAAATYVGGRCHKVFQSKEKRLQHDVWFQPHPCSHMSRNVYFSIRILSQTCFSRLRNFKFHYCAQIKSSRNSCASQWCHVASFQCYRSPGKQIKEISRFLL